jgi:simple sugar transport system permease protein
MESFGANKILESFWSFNILGVSIPTGTLLITFLFSILVYLFFRSKTGIAISAVGMNPTFAKATGINVDSSRVIANMMSTALGAVGIIVYAQGFGFAQFYDTPLLMAFPAVAAILVGGASAMRSKVYHVFIGCFLFQGLLTTAPPIIGRLMQDVEADITNPIRFIVMYGVILYALTKMGGRSK